jgi:hypothetical protein
MSSEPADTMKDYIWDSHLDLVRRFAPVELKDFGIIWLNPTNVGARTDSLEELNSYFLTIVDALDEAIQTDNDDEQNALATFLDDTMTGIVDSWLDGLEKYRIYPKANQSPDSFSQARIFEIMRLILKESDLVNSAKQVEPVVPVEPVVAPVEAPAEPAPVEPVPVEPVVHVEAPVEPAEPAVPAPAEPHPDTVRAALHKKRMTRKVRPHQASKTRKRRPLLSDGGGKS